MARKINVYVSDRDIKNLRQLEKILDRERSSVSRWFALAIQRELSSRNVVPPNPLAKYAKDSQQVLRDSK